MTDQMQRVIAPERTDVMGVGVDALTMDQTIDRLREMIATGKGQNHLSVNADKLVAAIEDPTKLEEFNQGTLVSADGQAVVWAARLLGRPPCRDARLPLGPLELLEQQEVRRL